MQSFVLVPPDRAGFSLPCYRATCLAFGRGFSLQQTWGNLSGMANPNPSPETRFKPGQSGNPGGKSGEQLRIDREAADLAARIRHKILSSLAGKLEEGEDPLQYVDAAMLKLFKDSEDRAHGTPKQSVDNTSSDGSMSLKALFDSINERGKTINDKD